MANDLNDPSIALPALGSPQSWEELEQSFASLQAWIAKQQNAFKALQKVVGQANLANTRDLVVAQLPFAATRFFAEGSAVWTVEQADVERLSYVRIGQFVWIEFQIFTSAITVDTTGSLFIRIPEFELLTGKNVDVSSIAVPTSTGGILNWLDTTNGASGIGIVSTVGSNYDGSGTRALTLQLDQCADRDGATSSMYRNWQLSSNLFVAGSIFFLALPRNIPGQS